MIKSFYFIHAYDIISFIHLFIPLNLSNINVQLYPFIWILINFDYFA